MAHFENIPESVKEIIMDGMQCPSCGAEALEEVGPCIGYDGPCGETWWECRACKAEFSDAQLKEAFAPDHEND